jgi:hypothetical protein
VFFHPRVKFGEKLLNGHKTFFNGSWQEILVATKHCFHQATKIEKNLDPNDLKGSLPFLV